MATKLSQYVLPSDLNEQEEDALFLFFLRSLHPTWDYNTSSTETNIMKEALNILVTPNVSKVDKTKSINQLFSILKVQVPDDTHMLHEIDVVLGRNYNSKMKNKYLKYKSKYLNLSRKNTV